MLLPNLARLDLRCRLEGIMIGGDADPREGKRALTEEEKVAKKVARQERKDAAEAKAQAARTVHVIEAELKKAKTDRDWEFRDEARREELHQQVRNLQQELEEKQAETKTFTAEDIRKALDALMPKLENEDVDVTVAALRALLKTYAKRISELQQKAMAVELSPTEHGELVALREANFRISVGVAAADKAASLRTSKRESKQRQQLALRSVKNPKHYLTDWDYAWWKTEGERVWNKLRKRDEDERLRKRAGLPASNSKKPLQEGVIDPNPNPGMSNKDKAMQLNQKLQALGLDAIKDMAEEMAKEKAAKDKVGNAVDGGDDSEDEDDV